MTRREFELMRLHETAKAEAKVDSLKQVFSDAKDRLIQAKQELYYWRQLTWEKYVNRN